MSEMVERVARRIALECWGENYDKLPDKLGEMAGGLADKSGAKMYARAAIAAILDHMEKMDVLPLFEGKKYPPPMAFPDAFAEAITYIRETALK